MSERDVDSLSRYPEYDRHEMVVELHDESIGLRGFIAIHNTKLGPAVGGTRMWNYASEEDALRDALRLSRAMTYKCAIAGVPYGGGKAVIMVPRDNSDAGRRAYLKAYAQKLLAMKRPFYTGEDVGLTESDVRLLVKQAKGRIIGDPDVGGLPGPWAAKGVFTAMRAALNSVYGSDSLSGKTIAIKGLGHTGGGLLALVSKERASVIAADIDEKQVLRVRQDFPNVRIVDAADVASAQADVYAPCAMGGEFTTGNVASLRARIICGAANNQLATPEVGAMLFEKGIAYVPDYLANAGGLINVVDELHAGGYSRERVAAQIDAIYGTTASIIEESKRSSRPTDVVSDEMALQRIRSGRV